ncbi:hypothetical protein CEXT_409231 [Caerostris extrusa]|uniref:Uncharacterized protein n=1 Tax=Caerostris extrusa TaxID=172846 RepID=A0AAV4VD71_CAEEX|nr:hypothetical protein CEXT_409231 [Caerostris extrusa]
MSTEQRKAAGPVRQGYPFEEVGPNDGLSFSPSNLNEERKAPSNTPIGLLPAQHGQEVGSRFPSLFQEIKDLTASV